jgi:hypothetical protein
MSQALGLSGTPSPGHWVAAAIRASCTASSAMSKCPYRRTTAPRTCGASGRSRSPTWSIYRSSTPSTTGECRRTPRRRPVHQAGGDLDGAVVAVALDDRVAGQHLLRLRVRPVGDDRAPRRAAGPGARAPARTAHGRRPTRPTRPAAGGRTPCTCACWPRPRPTSAACPSACRRARRSPAGTVSMIMYFIGPTPLVSPGTSGAAAAVPDISLAGGATTRFEVTGSAGPRRWSTAPARSGSR